MNRSERTAGISRPLTLLAAVAIAATVAGGQTPPPEPATVSEPLEVGLVEKTVVAVAQLEILATDAGGAAVDDLRPAEIRVFEDGVEQKLAFLERVSAGRVGIPDSTTDREPTTLYSERGEHPAGNALDVLPTIEIRRVVLVFDVRNSKKSVRKRWIEAARAWIESGMQPEDRVGIVTLGTYPEWIVEFTDERPALLAGIERAALNKKAAGRDRRRDMSRLSDDIRQCIEIESGRRASGTR